MKRAPSNPSLLMAILVVLLLSSPPFTTTTLAQSITENEEDGDVCAVDDDCLHGGFCNHPLQDGFGRGTHQPFCECPGPFGGRNCEELDCPDAKTCGSGGTCIAVPIDPLNLFTTTWTFACQCPTGKSGDKCQYSPTLSTNSHLDHKCLSNEECFNGGHCIVFDHDGISHPNYCECPQDFGGEHCERCPDDYCENGGTCIATTTEPTVGAAVMARSMDYFTCNCTAIPMWTGDRCQFASGAHDDTFANLHDCQSDIDCNNGAGECKISDHNEHPHPNFCDCFDGFRGKRCDETVETSAEAVVNDEGDDPTDPTQSATKAPPTSDTSSPPGEETEDRITSSSDSDNSSTTSETATIGIILGAVCATGAVLICLLMMAADKRRDKSLIIVDDQQSDEADMSSEPIMIKDLPEVV